MNNPWSLIIYRSYFDKQSQGKCLVHCIFFELWLNKGLGSQCKNNSSMLKTSCKLEEVCRGHTVRIDVYIAYAETIVSPALTSMGVPYNYQHLQYHWEQKMSLF